MLYYDATSQYYFNSKTNQYVYWNPEHATFIPAPSDDNGSKSNNDQEDSKKKDDKKDKVKTAKRIAKDMEKWAKTLNSKKAASQQQVASTMTPVTPQQPPVHSVNIGKIANNTEDIAFSMLQKQPSSAEESPAAATAAMAASGVGGGTAGLARLAGYGSDSEDDNAANNEEQQLTDWSKLACLLCKRQFPSREKLTK
jgi:RNA-binding protein 5/10